MSACESYCTQKRCNMCLPFEIEEWESQSRMESMQDVPGESSQAHGLNGSPAERILCSEHRAACPNLYRPNLKLPKPSQSGALVGTICTYEVSSLPVLVVVVGKLVRRHQSANDRNAIGADSATKLLLGRSIHMAHIELWRNNLRVTFFDRVLRVPTNW